MALQIVMNLAACGGTFSTGLTSPPWRDLLGLNLYPSNILEVTPLKYGHENQVWARD